MGKKPEIARFEQGGEVDDFSDLGRLPKQPAEQVDKNKPITAQEARFVEMYLAGTPAVHAYQDTHSGTEDMPYSRLQTKAQTLLKSPRIENYLTQIRTVKREERAAAQPGDIVAHIRDGASLSPLKILEDVLREMETTNIVVDMEMQQKRHYVVFLHAMMGRQYGAANQALKEMSELAGLKIERKEIRVGNLDDLNVQQLKDATFNQRQQLIELGFDPSELTWIDNGDGAAIAKPSGSKH
jgi:hypothetical protein